MVRRNAATAFVPSDRAVLLLDGLQARLRDRVSNDPTLAEHDAAASLAVSNLLRVPGAAAGGRGTPPNPSQAP